MTERTDIPEATRTRTANTAAGQSTRKPFVRPTVQDLGGLTLVTLGTSIPGGP